MATLITNELISELKARRRTLEGTKMRYSVQKPKLEEGGRDFYHTSLLNHVLRRKRRVLILVKSIEAPPNFDRAFLLHQELYQGTVV